MSRRRSHYRANPAPCACGATYERFRTGLTYREVYGFLWRAGDDTTTWVYKRRSSVLGHWRELKLMFWDGEHGGCGQ